MAVIGALALQQNLPPKPTANLDANGWVWIVCGLKAFIWNYQNTPVGNSFQLSLSDSDCGQCAGLVAVYQNNAAKELASCLSVTPNGIVRFWNIINLGNSFKEFFIKLYGDETITPLTTLHTPKLNCFAATSSGSLVHICFETLDKMNYWTMNPTPGVFSGISRVMSSLVFGGSVQAQSSSNRSAVRQLLTNGTVDGQKQYLFVLMEHCLQKWTVSDCQEKLIYESPVDSMFKEHLSDALWKRNSPLTKLSVRLMDMAFLRDGLMILGAVNCENSEELVYAL